MGIGNNLKVGALVLGIVAVIVLMFIAVTNEYSRVLRTSTPTAITALALPAAVNTSAAIGTSGQYPYPQSLTGCVNSTCTNNSDASCAFGTNLYTLETGNANGGAILLGQAAFGSWESENLNCSNLVYLADTDAQAAADLFVTGLAIFGSFAAVVALAIMGMVIIRLFTKK